ncbi:MAG: L-arabinose ABC transporter ATP-binding protein AraG [Candidatus Latescibacteria bacterium]|nr:L-arabinose ABC transporter ATP-binding protein AraG [Candidatus Latescibacterota bacterium]
MERAYLEFENISKMFPGVRALDTLCLKANEGSIHGIIGENGAGKSTLLKILSGVYIPSSGMFYLNGTAQAFTSAQSAIQSGIAVIYQELHLVPDMSVAENLLLGHLPNRFGLVDKAALQGKAHSVLESLAEDIDVNANVRSLPIARRQMVEIAKALIRNAKFIAFDEPTSSLTDREINNLFTIIRNLKKQGHVILYVSHRLNEIFELCDTVTILRDGKVVETCTNITSVNHDYFVRRMVGRSIENIYHYTPRQYGAPALEVKGLTGPGLKSPADITVSQGEIVGIFGLVGAGRTELLKCLYGAVKSHTEYIKIHGEGVTINNPTDAIGHGLVFIPEDRKFEGIIPSGSVSENINLSVRRLFSRFGLIDEKRERINAKHFVDYLSIRTPSLKQLICNLSGGNQQKVILARWLSEHVKVMLLDEPTRGVDIGAKSELYELILKLASKGIGIILVSSELPEILGISDRILVMRQGKIMISLNRDEATEEKVLHYALPEQ